MDPAAAYRDTRGRVSELVRGIADHEASALAPATPDWRVKDVLAHLVGGVADIVNGNLERAPGGAWTAKQVADRRDRSIAELLEEWDERGPALEAMIPTFPAVPLGMLLTDAATHEHDIHGALDRPGARDSSALVFGFEWFGRNPKIRLETDVGTFPGVDDTVPTVRASRFELFRASTGRRSREQIAAYDWDGEPRPEFIVGPIFTPRSTPLEE